ncbi:S9 family peptidase [Sphingomicrobium clamense]|uniref:Alpha/beta fold hydrolase n=1 Tax=Sphingomicrobium clamense TaxID=2851013 RepID=A0ABS6V6Y7_9SPHN|nr:alpha/beta fold hydrolase [Sphingomicrobium sp. B8]MBW0145330.1 alpha/beta fold hydrolase [Sphingomicrobium sp. B8]
MIRTVAIALFLGLASPVAGQTLEPLMPKVRAAMPAPPDFDARIDQRRVIDDGLFLHHPPLKEAVSSDGQWFVGHNQDGGLTIRRVDEAPRRLAGPEGSFRWTAEGARLSDDGRWIAAKMIDDSMVYASTISDMDGAPRTVRFSYAGKDLPEKRLFVLSRDGRTRVELPLSMDYLYLAGFDSDGRGLRYLEADRTGRHVVLNHFDLDDGSVTLLMEERSEDWTIAGYDLGDFYSSRFEGSNKLLLIDDDRFLWTSDRSGKRRLYAYAGNATPWPVSLPDDEILLEVVGIDRTAQIAIVKTAVGDATWPKHRLRSVDLVTLATASLLDAPYVLFADMTTEGIAVEITDLPSTLILRWIDYRGEPIKPDTVADVGFLTDLPVSVEKLELPGAEGDRLRAILVTPDGEGPFPLIDHIYGGPQSQMAEPDPVGRPMIAAMEMARRGFATVFIDARGTPGREAAFAHAQDGRFGAAVIPDHVAAIQALLKTNKRLDPDRVGIMGHSWGGYFALRGMIEGNDLFKAGIMLAPNTNVSEMRVPVEAYQGCLPSECPEAYEQGHLTNRLLELRGPLLIIHGLADDDVLPEVTDRLERDLIAAGADYETVRLPKTNHIVMRDPDHFDRVLAFWKRTLR